MLKFCKLSTATGGPLVKAADRSNRDLVPGEGVEPSRYFYRRILSPLRLPFRHPGLRGRAACRASRSSLSRTARATRGVDVASDMHQREAADHDGNRAGRVRDELQAAAARQ